MGAGGDVRQPLGLTVVAGLVVSQLVTLYLTPIVFLFFENLGKPPRTPRLLRVEAPALAATR
jgi:HAE1 family hydrophobic/amphiphilic exporter-1